MTTPTEGVKLEPLKGELYIYAIRAHRAHFGSDLKSAKEAVDSGWRLRSADKPEPLVSGPQAAKRIEELEAEVARLGHQVRLAVDGAQPLWSGEVGELETRALKAERQRDEAVGALEEAEETLRLVEHPRLPDRDYQAEIVALGSRIGYGALMSGASAAWRAVLGDRSGGEFVAGPCQSTVTAALTKARSVLSSIREG